MVLPPGSGRVHETLSEAAESSVKGLRGGSSHGGWSPSGWLLPTGAAERSAGPSSLALLGSREGLAMRAHQAGACSPGLAPRGLCCSRSGSATTPGAGGRRCGGSATTPDGSARTDTRESGRRPW